MKRNLCSQCGCFLGEVPDEYSRVSTCATCVNMQPAQPASEFALFEALDKLLGIPKKLAETAISYQLNLRVGHIPMLTIVSNVELDTAPLTQQFAVTPITEPQVAPALLATSPQPQTTDEPCST